MTMVNNILQQMPAVGQPQRTCLVRLGRTILALRGRVNVRHLRRDGDDAERPMARPWRRSFDWPDVHQRVSTTALAPQAAVLAAQAASCMPTSGTPTCGVGHFCTGGAGRAERGLEMSPRAVVEGTPRGAWTRAVAQPPPPWAPATTQDPEATLGACDAQPRRAQPHRLPAWGTSHAGDGDGAKQQSSADGVDRRRHPSTTRRGAAAGRFRFTGPPPPRRGAHRQSDGTGHGQDGSRFEALGTLAEAEQVPL